MGYKLLGFVVWQGGKWYLRRRTPSPGKLAVAGLAGAALVGGLIVAQRRIAS